MLRAWRRWHERRAWLRRPLKLGIFLVGAALVLYPRFWLFPTWLERIRDMETVIQPDHPALDLLERQVRSSLPADAAPADMLQAVQDTVYEHVPYAWDWETWGVVEYLPTVDEVFQLGREDCDGRAVVAASLLRRMGCDARLVSDVLHMWVETPAGDTMNPTGGEKTIVSAKGGTQTTISPRVLSNLARGLAYGVAVFPLGRELIILALLAALTSHPWCSGWRRLSGVLLLWIALDMLRHAGQSAALQKDAASVTVVLLGVLLALAGWLTLAFKDRGSPRVPAAAHPE